jgi:hypothetical protein
MLLLLILSLRWKGCTYAEGQHLHIRILVVKAAFQGIHCTLRRNRLGADLIAYLEIESNVLCAHEKLRGCFICYLS